MELGPYVTSSLRRPLGALILAGVLKTKAGVYAKLLVAMAPHSSTLAWKIPWMEEPGRLQSMGSLGVGHD